MKDFRNGFLVWVVIFIGVFTVVLAGCGGERPGQAATGKSVSDEAGKDDALVQPSKEPITQERTFYDFETDLQGWEVPAWAEEKNEYVAREVLVSKNEASRGEASMSVTADFPGGIWSAGLVEIQQYLDLSPYRVLSVDLYLPKDAPEGLKAKLILTVGKDWKFVEMNRSIPLIPGRWVTLTANIEPGSYDWKRVVPDEAFAEDIRKVAIRIESNRQPVYSGPVYVDNIRVGR